MPVSVKALAFLSLASVAGTVSGQELLTNGAFEGGSLPPWMITAASGSGVSIVAESSPFIALYGAGITSVRITDDDSDHERPKLGQNFEPQDAITFAFDFKMGPGESQSSWYLTWEGVADTTAFFFGVGGSDGKSFLLNQTPVTTLQREKWYHVEGWADGPRQIVRGSIVAWTGERTEFEGGFPFGLQGGLRTVHVSDGDAGQNDPVQFDNISTRPIALEIAKNAMGEVVVTWPSADFRLQSAGELDAPIEWTDVSTPVGAYTNSATSGLRFFRLVR